MGPPFGKWKSAYYGAFNTAPYIFLYGAVLYKTTPVQKGGGCGLNQSRIIVPLHLLHAPPTIRYKPKMKGDDDTSNFEQVPDSAELPPPLTGANDPFAHW